MMASPSPCLASAVDHTGQHGNRSNGNGNGNAGTVEESTWHVARAWRALGNAGGAAALFPGGEHHEHLDGVISDVRAVLKSWTERFAGQLPVTYDNCRVEED